MIKGISEAVEDEAKEQKGGFLGVLKGTLNVSLIGNLLTGKGTIRAGEGAVATSQGRGTTRAGEEDTISAGRHF